MTGTRALVHLHDLDLLLGEIRDAHLVARLRRAGLQLGDPAPVEKARVRLLEQLDARWRHLYERALRRYGAAVATVRGRVCQGCYMALPRSASPRDEEAVSVCESCGRILYWTRPAAI